MTPDKKIRKAQKLLVEARVDLSKILRDDRSRKRGVAVRLLHTVSQMLADGPSYFSQAGQDRIVDRVLGEKRDGVFADIGGYDGVTGSNTLFFEVFRGWTGILVEPSPTQIAKAKLIRRCPCLEFAVAGKTGLAEFMEVTEGFTQMSGFVDSYDPDILAQVRGDSRHKERLHKLDCKRLDEIFTEQKLSKIDFVSLDVEGGEMDILQGFDFNSFDIEMISVENNTMDPDLPTLMRDKGYDVIEFVGVDDLFRKRPKS